MTHLSTRTLAGLSGDVAVPRYDRTEVSAGIVHLSVGGFHRAHEAFYLDRLMNAGKAMDWGICGVGFLPSSADMRDVMAEQDCLYTVVVRHSDGTWEPTVVGSIVEYLFAPDSTEAVIEKMASPQIRIVSLTVTEGGYNLDPTSGRFDRSNPEVLADLEPGAAPGTMFGVVIEALARRRRRGVAPFTVMSCDNIAGNGHVCREVFTSFARMRDPDLGDWVAANVRFPSSMVDRITPQTTDGDRAELARRFHLDDRWPVVCEPFIQWVLEDEFSDGRPPLEDVGVQIVADVQPYELMKLRLLNASHQALCYAGYLAGYRFVHDVATDAVFASFLLDYMVQEAIPTLRPVPGIDPRHYAHQLIERFANPEVRDTVGRLCANTSDLIPKFLLPVLRAQLDGGGRFVRSAAVIASWARYCEGVDEAGAPIVIDDARAAQLHLAATRQHEHPLAFLQGNREIFGDLADDARFTTAYAGLLGSFHERGARATLADLDQYADAPTVGPAASATITG